MGEARSGRELIAEGEKRRAKSERRKAALSHIFGPLNLFAISTASRNGSVIGFFSGNSTPRLLSASSNLSVGVLPTNTSCAKGQPPRPPMAESKRRQPTS